MTKHITTDVYADLQAAYDYFNKAIWGGKLPECLITLPHHRGAYGHFGPKFFSERGGKKPNVTDEIALNPFYFHMRTDAQILSTLVHEQAHLWQHHFGTVSKTHHNREWANKMEEIGLMPSSTGEEGGKRTGRRVSHYIIKGGDFDKAMRKCDIKLKWIGVSRETVKKPKKRFKYCCPTCEQVAYGKAGLNIECGECSEAMEQQA